MALNGALLLPDGDPVLLCSGGEIDKARAGMPWIAEAHAIPIMEQAELVDGFVKDILLPVLRDRGLDSGRLGLDAVSISFIDAFRRHLPDVEMIDGDQVMQRARLIKNDVEIAIIHESCAIGDAVTQRALDETCLHRTGLQPTSSPATWTCVSSTSEQCGTVTLPTSVAPPSLASRQSHNRRSTPLCTKV